MRALAVAPLLLMGASLPAAAVTPEDYTVDTAADLVALCSVGPSDPDFVSAIHFCHGYGHGAVQYHLIQAAAVPDLRLFCIPDPAPTRQQAWDGFLSWMSENPDYLDREALDAVFTYLGAAYPLSLSERRIGCVGGTMKDTEEEWKR